MIAEALAYASHGWPVFVLSRTKVPVKNCPRCDPDNEAFTEHDREACPCLTCHGFYAATRDPERITEMLRRHPSGMLAIRTGAPSGLVVIDIDFKEFDDNGAVRRTDPGFATLTELDAAGLLPGTVMQISGSGGLHLLYAHPGGYIKSGAQLLGPGIDSKADGGYFLVAPSIHPRTRQPYQWSGDGRFDHPLPQLHDTLIERLRPPERQVRQPSIWDQFRNPGGARGRLGGLLRTVLESNGNRNDRLYWAAKKAGEMIAAGEIDQTTTIAALQEVGREIGLTDNEIGHETKGTIGSGLRNGMKAVA